MGTKNHLLDFWCRWELSHHVRVLVPWGGCVLSLKENHLDASLSRRFGGKDHHWFGELEMHLHRIWYHSLTPIFICMLFMFIFLWHALFYCSAYVMLIRLVLYMFSYLSTHVSYGFIFSVLTLFSTIMYALDLMYMHIHNAVSYTHLTLPTIYSV